MAKITPLELTRLPQTPLAKEPPARLAGNQETESNAVKISLPKKSVADAAREIHEKSFEGAESLVQLLSERLQESPVQAVNALGSLSADRVRDLLK